MKRKVKKRKRRTLNKRGKITLVIMVCSLLLALFFLLPCFKIKNIQVIGNQWINKDEILKQANLTIGKHMVHYINGSFSDRLALKDKTAEKNILKAFPNIEKVSVTYHFPRTLTVQVEPAQPICYLINKGDYLGVDFLANITSILDPEDPHISDLIELKKSDMATNDWGNLKIGDKLDPQTQKILFALNEIKKIDKEDKRSNKMELLPFIKTVQSNHGVLSFTIKDLYDDQQTITHEGVSKVTIKVDPFSNIGKQQLYWFKTAISTGIFDDLKEGTLDLLHEQRIYIPVSVEKSVEKIEK